MKKGLAYSIIAVLTVIAVAFAAIHFTNNADKTNKIEALTADIVDRDGQIATLNADVADKAEQIGTLNTDVADKAKQIETLSADVTDKAGQIETLTANISEKDGEIEALSADITDKAGQIETLNADIASKAETIKTLDADVADKAGQIETLNADVAEKAEKIKALDADVADKTKQIENLNADVAEKVGLIESLNAEVDKKAEQIETLNANVADKAEQIKTLKADVDEKTKEIETLNTTVKEKNGQIETLTADITEKAGQIDALTEDAASKAAQIETLSADIKKKEDQIELLKEMVSGNSAQPTSLHTDNDLVTVPTEEFVIERLSTVPDIAKIAAATEDNDPNGQLGKQGGYTAQIYFSSPLVNPAYANKPDLDVINAGTSCGGSIEVYATVTDAEKRDRYLAALDGGILSSGSHTVVGTMLVRTSSKLSASDQKKLEDEIINALTSEETPAVDKSNESSVPQELVTVKECGFQISHGYLKYAFIAHNNMTDKAAYLPSFRITVRDADGGLISTTDQVLNVIYPDQDTVYAGQGSKIDETPASIEVSYIEPDDDWHIVSTSKLEHDHYSPFEIKSSKLKDDRIIGELYNPNDYNQSMIAVTVIFRDKNGELLSGDTTFISNAKAGETVPFEIRVNKNLITESFEVFAQPW